MHSRIAGLILLAVTVGIVAGRGASAQAPSLIFPLLDTPESVARLVQAWNSQSDYVPGEVIVKFRSGGFGTAQSRALSVVRGAVDASAGKWVGDALLLPTPGEPDARLAAARLAEQPEVEWAHPNYLRTTHAVPNDPSYSRQWNFDVIDMPRAWDINPGATAEVIIAIVDTGVTTVSTTLTLPLWTGAAIEPVGIPVALPPDIAPSRILPGRDFVFWSGPVIDMVGHGTHLAGTALQETNNGLALAGIAYRARLMPLKACFGYWEIQFAQSAAGIPGFVDPSRTGTCPDSAVSEAIRFAADNGARVINLSLGGPQASPITREALQYAISRGAFIAISNGNQALRGNPVEYPAAYAPELNGVVSVGAVAPNLQRAIYSSTGPHLEIAAPGGDGRFGASALVYQVGLQASDFNAATVIIPRFDRYLEVPMQGTSMATPHVAGLAALLYGQGVRNPGAIEAGLRATARDLGTAGHDEEFGDGLIDARATVRGLGLAR
jgi:serine protease